MDLGVLAVMAKRAERLVSSNSPVLLTVAGVTGVLATAYFSAKSAFAAKEILDENPREDRDVDADRVEVLREQAKLTWKCYIPTAVSAGVTVAAIVASNRISAKRTAMAVSAYTLSSQAFAEYKERMKDKIGEKKVQAVHEELVQEKVNLRPESKEVVLLPDEQLCYDERSGRYFKSSMETIRKAQNDFNYRLANESYLSLTEFYDYLGIPANGESQNVGWVAEKPLELRFTGGVSREGRPYLGMVFENDPRMNYYNYR